MRGEGERGIYWKGEMGWGDIRQGEMQGLGICTILFKILLSISE